MELRKIEYELQEIRIALQIIAKYVILKENKERGAKQNEKDNKERTAGTI